MDEYSVHDDLRSLGHRSVISYVHRRMEVVLSCVSVFLSLNGLSILVFVCSFIAQSHDKYNVTQGPTCGIGWLDSCILGRYLTAVANNVFNSMKVVTSCACTV
jgi:hypothetical protein